MNPDPSGATSARECNIYHHDGAYKCFTHNRCWGAITNAVDPCPGWKEPELVTVPTARDLLAEIDATMKLGRERHLDFREQAYDLLVRLRPLVEREERLRKACQPIIDLEESDALMPEGEAESVEWHLAVDDLRKALEG